MAERCLSSRLDCTAQISKQQKKKLWAVESTYWSTGQPTDNVFKWQCYAKHNDVTLENSLNNCNPNVSPCL